MKEEYAGKEKEEGPMLSLRISKSKISLDVKPDVGIPQMPWHNNGWKLTPLKSAVVSDTCFSNYTIKLISLAQMEKESVDNYKPGKVIPHFSINLKLEDNSRPQSLSQQVELLGVKPTSFITILREPEHGL